MVFTSPIFIFLFLPIVLVLNYFFKSSRKIQNYILLFFSLLFYAWGEPKFTIIMVTSIMINWLWGMMIGRSESFAVQRIVLILAVIWNLSILFFFKYFMFVIEQLEIIGLNINALHGLRITLPIGISFFTFQALSYVIDVYKINTKMHQDVDTTKSVRGWYQRNPLYVGLYIVFFPQLIAGPIVRYSSIEKQIIGRNECIEKFCKGSIRFLQGFSKKVLLANTFAIVADKAFSFSPNELSTSFAWLGSVAYTLQIYFDFSGYSDMAIGLGKLFGFDFDENFNSPYRATSITDFWRKWHISLSLWFRDYIYIPLGGNRSGNVIKNFRNLFIVWLLTGIWHGANWTFMAWGLLYFIILVLEKELYGRWLAGHKIIAHIYTLGVVNFLWVIFRADSLKEAIKYIMIMFGIGKGTLPLGVTVVYIRENIIWLIAATILLFGLEKKFEVMHGNVFCRVILTFLTLLCFVISIVYMINGTYNPFIYFNF